MKNVTSKGSACPYNRVRSKRELKQPSSLQLLQHIDFPLSTL